MRFYLLCEGERGTGRQEARAFLFKRSAMSAVKRRMNNGGDWKPVDDHDTQATEFWITSAMWMSIVPMVLRFWDWSLRRWFRARCHWQNLNDKKDGKQGSGIVHGRAWFHRPYSEGKRQKEFHVEWSLWTRFWALQLDVGSGDANNGISLWIAFGLLSLHLTLEGILPKSVIERGCKRALKTEYLGYEYMAWPRTTGVRIFENTIWFDIWDWDGGWDRRQPKWMSFNFCPVDFFFGQRKYSSREIVSAEQSVVMPEGSYPVVVKMTEDTWRRPRWPWPVRIYRAHVDCERGIPKPGKGENSWDCGDDALFGMTCATDSVDEALDKMKASVLRDRERHGGKNWQPTLATV